ncbi:aminodeoxychorismate/anthranilate synthase component II [Pasteurella multocida]|uniref:aminodeoxychorismate/anthranilate synthase component II n=1 Tax=Pasteurella multocida TaxID=747 RepID=UPI000D343DDC|nr:aminodeoxychorismate/anthranilate synthase component II [Pasteurella multocida]AWB53851.1 type 1 glutamine amidotransferase [Pasteurella multocida]HDR1023798.1 aminodeoxychorismate/anthranilate synthase component II [Pasteurella multocida]HDR1152962.1 aminodeoxychorismate/anthranilate synthase component II [Pasteurella multocida]HDR1158860.1 aminodeoxychorismate/anthranilate synthase component II [Pasteurella multocida]HDR1171744.1 aminodeoxychorismate/anthranilate synthase component II [Pa
MAKIVFLDNFDSFTYNLVDQLRCLGHQVHIYRNDCDLDVLEQVTLAQPDTILALSPGPSTPQQAGNMLPLIQRLKQKVRMIGICLGHQAIVEAFGGKVIHAGEVLHGKVSNITHDQQMMFAHLPNPMPVARYHSLMGIDLSDEFIVNATYHDIIMAIRHKHLPICSFQFHPESILTVQGSQLLAQSIEWLLAHEI